MSRFQPFQRDRGIGQDEYDSAYKTFVSGTTRQGVTKNPSLDDYDEERDRLNNLELAPYQGSFGRY